MTLAVDTDVLVSWSMTGAPHHRATRRFLEHELRDGTKLAVAAQVLFELIYVCTDPRRFEHPLSMPQAIGFARDLWEGQDVVRLVLTPVVPRRAFELLDALKLGRKRILDTVLAATIEAGGIRRLATFNARDFKVFTFLDVVVPT